MPTCVQEMSDSTDIVKPNRSFTAGAIIAAMLLLSMSLWTVVPLGWIWIGSQLSKTQFPSVGPYMLVLGGIIITIVALAWVLGRLNHLYIRVTGTSTVRAARASWLKSLRDSEGPNEGPTVIETVIVASAMFAIAALAIWFLLIAGSPLPNGSP